MNDIKIDEYCRDCLSYCFWSDPYWENRYVNIETPEPFRLGLYREWIRVAIRYWIQIASVTRKEEMEKMNQEENDEIEIENEKKKKLIKLLENERKGIERNDDWTPDVEHEPDPILVYIEDHTLTWKKLYSKTGKIPKDMKIFFRENNLKKSKAKKILGIDPGAASLKMNKAEMKMAILGHDPLERAVWGARLAPPGRSEVVSADIGALREFTGMSELAEARVTRTEGEEGHVIEQIYIVDDNEVDEIA